VECVKTLIELGARVDLVLKHGHFETALQAAEAVFAEDKLQYYLKLRTDYGEREMWEFHDMLAGKATEVLSRGKAEVAEILCQHANAVA
jgi:hypothetical protein